MGAKPTQRAQRWKRRMLRNNKKHPMKPPTPEVFTPSIILHTGVGLIMGIEKHSIPTQGAWARSVPKQFKKPSRARRVG